MAACPVQGHHNIVAIGYSKASKMRVGLYSTPSMEQVHKNNDPSSASPMPELMQLGDASNDTRWLPIITMRSCSTDLLLAVLLGIQSLQTSWPRSTRDTCVFGTSTYRPTLCNHRHRLLRPLSVCRILASDGIHTKPPLEWQPRIQTLFRDGTLAH